MTGKSQNSFSLAVHGGAGGTLEKARKSEAAVRDALRDALEAGRAVLAGGGAALDAARLCVRILEDNPLFNAGCGAVANAEGVYELDASVMDGKTLKAGAVAAVVNVKNPVDLAWLVMKKTPHVLLSGKGAIDFARAQGVAMVTQKYFRDAQEKERRLIDARKKYGTVGAVARDMRGNLAAATSTGGWKTKMPGRIGDSPLTGAGNFADNESGAMSCTGCGEDFIRTVLSGYAGFLMGREGMEAKQAAQEVIDYLRRKVKGEGGFILLDKEGNVAAAQSVAVMRCGWIERGGESVTTIRTAIRPSRS